MSNATVSAALEPGTTFVHVKKLNLGTVYYARVRKVDGTGLLGVASEWSDPIELPCPTGAQCGEEGSMEGVSLSAVLPKSGECT